MSEVWTVLLSVLIALLVIYQYAFRNLDYFRKRGVPFIPPLPLLGNMAQNLFRKRTFAETIISAYNFNRDAKYVGFFDFTDPTVILRDHELIKLVAIKNIEHFPNHKMLAEEVPDRIFRNNLFGLKDQRWRDMRALLSPAFTASKMKILFKLIKECSTNLVKHMKGVAVENSEFEMRDLITKYTNDVIVTSAFGIGVDSLKDPKNDFILMGKEATNFNGPRSLRLFMLRIFPTLSKLLDVKLFSSTITKFYKNVVTTTIAARDAQGIVRPDMLQLMMQARDRSENLKLTDDDMTAHAFIFYFGGYDTASLLISFAVHQIAVDTDVHEKLQAEVDQVMENCDGDVTYEALHSMEYLDAILNECLRLYPPAIVTDRLCKEKFELPPAKPGLKPFVVEPGVSLWLPIAALHRDPEYFKNSEKFNPDRFLPENKDDIDIEKFMPFGIGPRFCIGNRFALMVAKLVVFELMASFNISPCAKTVDPIKLSVASFNVSIDGGVWLKVEPRSS